MRPMFLTTVAILGSMAGTAQAGPRDAMWNQVNEAIQKGLPKTAIESLDPIYPKAMADKAYAEAIKAIGMKIALEGNIEGNKAEEKIIRLQAEIDQAVPADEAGDGGDPGPLVLAVLPAEPLAIPAADADGPVAGPGPQTWDLPRILAEIDRHFT